MHNMCTDIVTTRNETRKMGFLVFGSLEEERKGLPDPKIVQ